MICCDTCPYSPTCEEEDDFLTSIGLADQSCCKHCVHSPGYRHTEPCLVCDLGVEGLS
jgi:hypothetical protein